ncbi:TetR/AcrR family transcriptional regulator [Anaerocolumna xylanovorans]|uniref:Transcriptional regulator, TetR family n=1 Tax=Anaerocolumna xylanovorans DSM 12503 TaxID=1121345 RepID=A0A1M7YG26_9FIRM|nr:TetR/AcrR family transcriptional regulator [Anaerocolumna xylanovorans]SHO51541.1 transcriptional regulator, TetR family [Anaerocolumna xylanovorans DSM 12503]
MRDTKETILEKALALFSVKGYDGVSMSDIADAVGIKAASIYKHYSGKEDIFYTIVQRFEEKTESIFEPALPDGREYLDISRETLVYMIQQTFQVYAEEPFVSKCRKLFLISAFNREDIGNLYAKYFIVAPMQYQAAIFEIILKAKALEGRDTAMMAYHFYTPILILLQEYDYKNITMEEALKKIELLVTQFAEVYGL